MNQMVLSSTLNLKILLLFFIFAFLNVCCESSSAVAASAGIGSEKEGTLAICDPECSYGYNCIYKSGKKTCVFSTTLIIIIVVVSIIGVCVIAAGIFFICICYCAAFNQTRLSRFFIKPKTQSEAERDRIKYLEKIKKRPANSSNYFDEVRKKSKSRLEAEGIVMDETTASYGSSGNEKTFRNKQPPKTPPSPILDEKRKSKAIHEIFPSDGNNKAVAAAVKLSTMGTTSPAASPATSTKEKTTASPSNKRAVKSPGKI